MVRTAIIKVNDQEYTAAYTPGCLQCIEDLGYADYAAMMGDSTHAVRNALCVVEAMIKCGAYLDKRNGKEGKTVTMDDLRYTMSQEEMEGAFKAINLLMSEKPDVEAEVPKK